MNPERFRRVEALYHAIRDAPAAKRERLLAGAEPELRAEVERLLSQGSGDPVLDRPAVLHAAELLDDPTTLAVESGVRLGPYRLEHKVGEGGMGDVFHAVDTRLGRPVAVKITREGFSARFEREARAIASLNHPHICTVYDVGPNYLVMELVQGETIASRLKRGPLPAGEAILYASQIAAALAEAHSKGIVHRDLKPANVMLTRTGVKVLDFGLAMLDGATTLTVERMVMGTPAYMAPEQRAGESADARTDIYAFGCVLYEMLTGTRVSSQRKRLPSRPLETIVRRCLEEDPAQRWQTATDVQRQLAAIAPSRRSTRVAAIAGVVLVLVLVAVAAYLALRPGPASADSQTVVLADITNTTGDPVFDDILRDSLTAELGKSPSLGLLPEEQLRRTLSLMNQPQDARVTPNIAQGVCVWTGSAAVLQGSIATLGSQYVLAVRAINCQTGDVLANEQAPSARKEDVLGAFIQIAAPSVTRMSDSLAVVGRRSFPLEEATTPSIEAAKAYSTAMKAFLSGDPVAQQLFERAITLDPDFASAHALLGFSYSGQGESTRARGPIARAYELRDRVSDRERFFIATLHDRDVTGNLERQQQTLAAWARTYPRDGWPSGLLSGLATTSIGEYQRSIEAAETSIALNPKLPPPYATKARSALHLGRLADADATLRQAAERELMVRDYLIVPYLIAAVRGDEDGMTHAASAARAHAVGRQLDDMLSHLEALGRARMGRLQEARRTARVAADRAREFGRLERAATFDAAVAIWEAFYGDTAAARRIAGEALTRARGRDLDYAAAFALALAGSASRARSIADDLARTFPEDTSVQSIYLPTLRALLALDASRPADAIRELEPASRFDLALGGLGFNAYYGAMYPVYVRGLACLAAHQPENAAAEFQKIVDHRSIVVADPVDAMARLHLARAHALSGDIDKARTTYGDLMALWKDADPTAPLVRQARAEYASLR